MATDKIKSGIYIIRNLINDKIYIGSSADVNKRIVTHKSRLNLNKHHSIILQRAYNKYGSENFVFEIFEYIEDKTKLLEREQNWLDFFKPEYNISKIAGSPMLGKKHSDATKKLLSEQRKGHKHYGPFKHSDETKELMSKLRIGEKNSNSKKILINGVLFNTIKEGAEFLGITPDYLRKCIKNNKKYKTNNIAYVG